MDDDSVKWHSQPQHHDYDAAQHYLSLISTPGHAEFIADALETLEEIEHWKAKDILRASRLTLLPISNPHVDGDLKKITKGEKLSPILLVRGNVFKDRPLEIADGYHRVCASYHWDENTDIPCHIVDWDD